SFSSKLDQWLFFQLGNVFRRDEKGTYHDDIREETNILFGLAGFKSIEHWKTEPVHYDSFDLKASIHSFLTELGIEGAVEQSVDKENILYYHINDRRIGKLHNVSDEMLNHYDIELPAMVAELSLTQIQKERQRMGEQPYESVSKFPAFDF